ncbi:hypothetical protein KAU11_10660 [Candidatus Babeliales bacterium]|nr:hypothetical protein [Candidatus Babeliales bacterium]
MSVEKAKTSKELLADLFRGKESSESKTEYTKAVLNHLQEKHGFTEFYKKLFKAMKPLFKTVLEWSKAGQTVTGNENEYLTGILKLKRRNII